MIGGGSGVEMVVVVTLPMTFNASLVALYIFNKFSRRSLSELDSSINDP